jgi:oxaloacetate decarboxylase gamma subunit
MEPSLIDQGLELMLFGMGTVVVFLTLLVLATTALSAFILRFAPMPVAVDSGKETTDDPLLLAVITAAIKKHRSRR